MSTAPAKKRGRPVGSTTKNRCKPVVVAGQNGVISVKARSYWMDVSEVMEYLDCGKSKAYKVIQTLNQELVDQGRIIPGLKNGHVPRKYFFKRCLLVDE